MNRPDYHEAKLYKGLALRQAAHAAQAGLRAMHGAAESLPEAEREGHLAPRRLRFQWDEQLWATLTSLSQFFST